VTTVLTSVGGPLGFGMRVYVLYVGLSTAARWIAPCVWGYIGAAGYIALVAPLPAFVILGSFSRGVRQWLRRTVRTATLAADQKQLDRRYCQDDDLYWGTYNDVVRNHRTAGQGIRRRRLDGKPAVQRHHRFDGTGTISVQLQRSAAMPPRSSQTAG
jgi:hypothetical protein